MCRQLFRARNACAESSSEESTKSGHGTKLGPTLCYTCRRSQLSFLSHAYQVANEIWVCEGKSVSKFDGSISDYKKQLAKKMGAFKV